MSKKHKKGRRYNPMAQPMFQVQADALMLAHAERVADTSTTIEALAERWPDKYGTLISSMQDMVSKAYSTGNVVTLQGALSLCEKVYRETAQEYRARDGDA
jgi:uncharacterized protein (DUF305 family)